MLSVEGLSVSFDRDGAAAPPSYALRDVSFSVQAGSRFALVGESGSGKSTALLAIMGLLPASATVSGRAVVDGLDMLPLDDAAAARRRWQDIGMVFQGAMSAFNPVRTVGWQIEEALRLHTDLERGDRRRRIEGLLDSVGLTGRVDRCYPHELSGGMRQRAMIAMALACDPKVLLADEPTTALDVVVQAQILRLLRRLCDELAIALVFVTHDLGVVAEMCDEAAVLRRGELLEIGAVEDLYRRPAHPYTRHLFAATPSLRTAATDARASSPSAPAAAPVLQLEDVSVRYVRRRGPLGQRGRAGRVVEAVQGASLAVSAGEVVALVGESGSGKTSLASAVLGLVPYRGAIHFEGQDLGALRGRSLRRRRRHLQAVFQDAYEAFDPRATVASAVTEPLRVHRAGGDRAARRQRAIEALRRVSLEPAEEMLRRRPHELSGGERQRVAIATALMLEPRVLVADEPVSMLDVSHRLGVLEVLRSLADDGLGILMITHDLSTAAAFADRIVVMKDGRIVEAGSARSVVLEPRDDYTRTLVAAVPDPDPAHRWDRAAAGTGAS